MNYITRQYATLFLSFSFFQEDDIIIKMVKEYGPTKWSAISQALPGRIGKQCRERYVTLSIDNINSQVQGIYYW
jgi:hypothetical protein